MNHTKILLSVLFLITISQVSLNIIVPILPVLVDKFNSSPGALQMSISIYAIAFGFSSLFYGPFSDYFGRKPIIIFGISIHLIGTIIAALSFDLPSLLLGRFLQGTGGGATGLVARAIIRDYFEGKEMHKVVALLIMVMAISPAVAPAIGGFLYTWIDWQAIFGFVAIYIILILLFTSLYLPETNKTIKAFPLSIRKSLHFYSFLLRHKGYRINVLAIFFSYSSQVVFLSVSPFVFQTHLNVSPEFFGNLIFLPAFGYFLGGMLIKVLHKYISRVKIMKMGSLILMFSGLGWLISYLSGYFTVVSTIIPIILGIVGVAIVFSSATAGFLEPFPDIAGTATALAAFVQMAGAAVVNFAINACQFTTPVIISIVFMFFGSLIYWMFREKVSVESIKPNVEQS